MRGPEPKFKKGDRVIDFRGRTGVVRRTERSPDWQSRSHRVEVIWDEGPNREDRRAFYEEVFDYADPHSNHP